MMWKTFQSISVQIFVLLAPTNGAPAANKPPTHSNGIQLECGVYLAESTIPHAGLGMYAGKDFRKDDQITEGDIIIPLIEIDWHNNHDENWTFLWDDYVWSKADVLGMGLEEVEGDEASAASTGIGSAINCRLSMTNIEGSYTKIDNAGLHRSRDAGAGAITPYHDRRGIATEDISAGQELFIFYGENYFSSRQKTYGFVPLLEDFDVADHLLKNFTKLLPPNDTSLSLRQGLLGMVRKFPFEHGAINALPSNASLIEHVLEVGTGKQYESIRDLEWLQQHGTCVDNIKPGLSTIPGAGRGAFAKRFLSKGTVVAPSPLLHIPNKTRMLTYESETTPNEDGQLERNASAPVSQQLLVNYCFGHKNSSLLLSSYGLATGLINHSSKNPNVRLEWSNIMMHPEWLNLSLADLAKQNHAGLILDCVALQDIQEGEEILLDYGAEWQQAWDQHVAKWKPSPQSDKYIPAFELDQDPDSIVPTIHEEPFSDNVLLYLYEDYRLMHGLEPSTEKRKDWLRPRVLDRYVDKETNETLYMVEIFHEDDDDLQRKTFVTYDREILFGVPRDAFQFLDAPYSRDHSQDSSFRQPMGIPDDIMPEAWMDL